MPIFVDGKIPEPAARAMSEVFLHPQAFTIGVEHRAPEWNPEELIGISTLYMAPRIPEGVPGEHATVVDPAKRFEGRFNDAVTTFLKGYFGRLAPYKLVLGRFVKDPPSLKALTALSLEALRVVDRSRLKTVVAVAVTGTLERPVAELVVPQKVGNELGVLIRDRMISDSSSIEVSEAMRPKIMTQHPMVQDLGVLAAANLMPLEFV